MIREYIRELTNAVRTGWDQFWFAPSDPLTLGVVRLLTGLMVCYTHAVWTLDLAAYFGPHSWLNEDAVSTLQAGEAHWSHWWLIAATGSTGIMWTCHLLAVGICACFALGLWTRVTSVLTWLITISYAQRVPEAMYGLDQINSWLMFSLMLSPSGAALSLDRLLARRRAPQPVVYSVGATVGIRLMQLHLCLVYLSAGLGKLQGPAWWDGTALWGAIANQEYQTLDLTWLVHYPLLVNLITHATVAWELSYVVLIWPRLTRPLVLLLAVPVHGGICLALGMPTFGLIMLVANLAFMPPQFLRQLLNRIGQAPLTGEHSLSAPKFHTHSGSGKRAGQATNG